jgi:putative flippase GtrA
MAILKYVVVGGSTFLIDLGLLILLREVAHVAILLATTISYWASIAFNFFTNRAWTFQAQARLRRHALPYVLLLLTNYVVTIGLVGGLSHLGVNYAIAKVLAVGVSMSWTYIAYKKLIFV